MIKKGRKTKQWDKVRRELVKQFDAMDIRQCELCGSRFGLSFAHSLKRRHINSDELLREVALLCVHPCHEQLERLPEAEMAIKIREIIALRGIYQGV